MPIPLRQALLKRMPYNATVVNKLELPIPSDIQWKLSDRLQKHECHIREKLITDGEEIKSIQYEIVYGAATVVSEGGKKEIKTTMESIEIPESSWSIDREWFDDGCDWVVDDLDEVKLGRISVQIVIQTPLRGGKKFVKFLFQKANKDFNLQISRNSYIPEEIFKDLKTFQNSVIVYNRERKVQHEKLSAYLRPYQMRAVQWMISRECEKLRMDEVHEPEYKLSTMYGTDFYYYPYTDILLKRPYPKYDIPKYYRGGILADEMGLGKTVVVLGVILNNPRNNLVSEPIPEVSEFDFEELKPSVSKKRKKHDEGEPKVKCVCRDRTLIDVVKCPECSLYQHKSCMRYKAGHVYFCSACWENQSVKSKATLIIVPQSILKQWEDEIAKHVDEDAWDNGVFVYTGLKDGFVQPSVLASYDIVLTTYGVLSDEFDYTNLRRKNGLFLKQVPPILRVEWWRLCLDEAQMVEEGRTKGGHFIAGTMAKLIPAVNKWNVTGTPVQSSIDELYNLTNWIGVAPFDNKNFWDSILMGLYWKGYVVPLFSMLSQIFWRNSKEDVENELTIPDITTIYHPLQFTPIESSFYMREHDAVYENFRSKLSGQSNFLRTLINRGMTLERILAPMLHLRQTCTHHMAVRDNEIAKKGKGDENNYMTLGSLLKFLIEKTKNECDKSLKTYLDSASRLAGVAALNDEWEEAAGYYNRSLMIIKEYEEKGVDADVLQNVHAAVNLKDIMKEHPDISSDFKIDELEQMESDLSSKYLSGAVNEFETNDKLAKSLIEKVESLVANSWECPTSLTLNKDLISRIQKDFENDIEFLESISEDMPGTINIWLSDLRENRNFAVDLVKKLCERDVDDLVAEAADCHLRKQRKRYCRLCRCKYALQSYKNCLFANVQETKPQKVEILMNLIQNLSRLKTSAFGKQIESLQVMKDEFKQLRVVSKALIDLTGKKDKLIKSKSMKDESEVEDLDELKRKLKEKAQSAISTLRKKYGTSLYLQNLDKNSERDPCPICFFSLEKEWCVLQCGHYYCTTCMTKLRRTQRDVPCPTCREVTAGPDIGYVSAKSVLYSTKISAIIDTLLELKESDPSVKVLIFSTWDIVLNVLIRALNENDVSYRRLPGENPEKNLQDFKSAQLAVTALLFPISYGLTGLNLVEANHVFFIEPTVNITEEMQGIGRIHRMGQTKNTFVHRFFMAGTIEDKIQAAVKDAKYMPTYSALEDVQRFYDT